MFLQSKWTVRIIYSCNKAITMALPNGTFFFCLKLGFTFNSSGFNVQLGTISHNNARGVQHLGSCQNWAKLPFPITYARLFFRVPKFSIKLEMLLGTSSTNLYLVLKIFTQNESTLEIILDPNSSKNLKVFNIFPRKLMLTYNSHYQNICELKIEFGFRCQNLTYMIFKFFV